MKVSTTWLKQLVDLNISVDDLVKLLPLRTIGTKEVTEDFVELDMKGYNRADLLSMRGVAYEVGAITGSKVLFEEPQEANFAWNQSEQPKLQATVQDPDLSPLYCLARIEGLKANFSNPEDVKRLNDSGMRSVNNIADITNLIMLEYGQPLHAFASETVKGNIIVRTAKAGEELKTLDGKTRKLTPTTLVIADEEKALGVAGVMGGLNSEVTNETSTILLEAAIFNPVNIRKTTTALGLPSEASKRFQHGLTKKRLFQALDAAIKRYEQLGGKLAGFVIIGDTQETQPTIDLNQEKTNSLIGVEITKGQIEDYLKSLYFDVNAKAAGNWEVVPPYWRLDVKIQEDVIEEVARMYGYEKIPAKPLQGEFPKKVDQSLFETIKNIRETLASEGLTEVNTYSFYSTNVLQAMGWMEEGNSQYLVKIANPISAETQYMRLNLWPNLVEVVDQNIRQGFDDIAVFEIGKVYTPNNLSLPKEEYRLAIALMNGSDNPMEELLAISNQAMQISSNIEIKESKPQGVGTKLFHPTRFVEVFKDGKQIGGISEVHPRLLDKLGISKRVAILEISIDSLVK